MRAYLFAVLFLATVALSLGSLLEPTFQVWEGNRARSGTLLETALGDSRKLFSKHFFSKADTYFHNGYYPTIYDNADGFKEAHISGGTHQNGEQEEAEENFLGKPKDFIDAFGRHFYPSRHTHLGESACNESGCPHSRSDSAGAAHPADGHPAHDEPGAGADHQNHAGKTSGSSGLEREILPWLRLSAELDPERAETYVVASFWLRSKLGQVDHAEQFLREGLQANPGDHEILFELGRIFYENRHDVVRARNVWELALKSWRERESAKTEPNLLVLSGILNHLAMLERDEHNYPRAIEHYEALKKVSPNEASIQSWIDYLKTNGPPLKLELTAP